MNIRFISVKKEIDAVSKRSWKRRTHCQDCLKSFKIVKRKEYKNNRKYNAGLQTTIYTGRCVDCMRRYNRERSRVYKRRVGKNVNRPTYEKLSSWAPKPVVDMFEQRMRLMTDQASKGLPLEHSPIFDKG